MTDPRDGKTYATIVLHGYTVMAQNLDYGTQVPGMNVTDNQSNDGGVVEKYCYNDSALYCERYGGLYQWAEALALPSRCNAESCADLVDTVGFHQGICPPGWHLPGFVEWGNKIAYSTVAKEMKSEIYWYQGGGGSNSTGFTFLPAGERIDNEEGGYMSLSEVGRIWYIALYASNVNYARTVTMYYSDNGVATMNYWAKTGGVSVRCIQDYAAGK